mgnify:CR=1 FL=1
MHVVRVLGLINGIVETIAMWQGSRRRIAAIYDNGLVGFEEYDQKLIQEESGE